jgi:hypothetical protein
MKHHYAYLRFVFIGLCLLFSGRASAVVGNLTRLEESLENRILPIVRTYDAKALVIVRATPVATNAPMPMTPFVMKDLSIEGAAGDAIIRRVDVTVVSRLKELPADVSRFIKDICSGPGERVGVSIKTEMLNEGGTRFLASTSLGSFWNGTGTSVGFFALLFLAATLIPNGIFFLLFLVLFRRGRAFEGSSASGITSDAAAEANRLARSDRGHGAGQDAAVEHAVSKFPVEACVALLTDCYWGQFDGYANYIWNRLPFDLRKTILTDEPLIDEYSHHLNGVEEKNLNCEQDAYYLDPLPFSQIDNAALTNLVKQHPSLMNQLSTLRLDGLELSARDRIDLMKMAQAQKDLVLPKFNKLPPSPLRKFAHRLGMIRLQDFDEEQELLQMRDLGLEFIQKIPSLGWILRLSKEEAEKLLHFFSARDLATAWIGPPEVLEKLMNCLPEKKREMIVSYLQRTRPSRTSQTFQKIHSLTIEALKHADKKESRKKKSPKTLDFAA